MAELPIDSRLLVELTQRLVQAPGENPPGDEAATADVLCAAASGLGLDVSRYDVAPGRPNVTISLREGCRDGPGLLLLGHTDVVPAGDGWTVDPFGGQLADGRIYGRGTSDMKGGLAAALVAMSALRTSRLTGGAARRSQTGAADDAKDSGALSGPVHLVALADEEQNGIGVRDWIARERLDLAGCIVAEPTQMQTIIAARGASYLEFRVHGQAAHAGRPKDGRNAIYGAAAIVSELERWHRELADDPHPLVGPATINVGTISGGTGGSIVPDLCTVAVDWRLLPGQPIGTVVEAVRTRIEGLGLQDRGLRWELTSPMDMPGYQTPAEHPFVTSVEAARLAAGGAPLPLAGWSAACDGGFVHERWDIPVVTLGPGSVNEQAHRADESVAVAELELAARTYALAARRLLG